MKTAEKIKNDNTLAVSLVIGEIVIHTEAKRKLKDLLTRYANIFSKRTSHISTYGKFKHKIETAGEKLKCC